MRRLPLLCTFLSIIVCVCCCMGYASECYTHSHDVPIHLEVELSSETVIVGDTIWTTPCDTVTANVSAYDCDLIGSGCQWDTVLVNGEPRRSVYESTWPGGVYLAAQDSGWQITADDVCGDGPHATEIDDYAVGSDAYNVISVEPDLTVYAPVSGNEDVAPGALISLNDRDEDLNCVPDYQDNANRATPVSTAGFISVGVDFTPGRFDYPNTWLNYMEGSELSIEVTGGVRVWIQEIEDPEGPLHKATSLHWVMGEDTIPYLIFLEGGATGPVTVTLTLAHHDPELTCEDTVCLTVVSADLDVDSDNTGSMALPDRSYAEECVEDVFGDDQRPGKIIQVDTLDSDRDGVPDFADGFDLNPLLACDDSSASSGFVPIVLELSQFEGVEDATVVLRYSASDPAGMQITLDDPFVLPSSGALRIWTKDAGGARNKASLLEGGDFVAPDIEYSAEQLGLTGGSTTTLYVEAVAISLLTADMCIVADVYPVPGVWYRDKIRLTAVRQQILAKNIDEFDFREVDGFVATGLPQAGTPTEEGHAGAYQLYRIRVNDPRSGFSHIMVNDQEVPVVQAGNAYITTEDFVGITAEDQAVLAADEEYQLTVTNADEEEFAYNADVTPDNAGADPIVWTVEDNGAPPSISCADGILTINSVGGSYTYRSSVADTDYWKPEKETVVDVVFKIVEYDSQGADGGLKVILGDNQNSWEIGIRPDRLVTYPSGVRTESAVFASTIGDNGSLIDGNFHTLRFARDAGANTATVTLIDSDADVFEFEQVGRGTGSFGIAWGDTGSDIRGHVRIDAVSWVHTDTPQEEVVYSARPSDVVGAHRVLLFSGDDLDVAYNPAWLNPLNWFRKEADASKVIGDLVVSEAQKLNDGHWDHVVDGGYSIGDDGDFGKEVHKCVSAKLNKSNGWLTDVVVRQSDKKILKVGQGPGGAGTVQVDAIHLQAGYRPKVGDILDTTKTRVFEIKTSINGGVNPLQVGKLKALVGNKEVWLCRSKVAYQTNTRAFTTNMRFSKAAKIFTIVGMVTSVYCIIHSADYEDEFQEIVDLLDQAKVDDDPASRHVTLALAADAMRRYLSHFVPNPEIVDIMMHRRILSILSEW